jgi:MFS transporter, PAT family, beta-lactamase induction signal transducer AmpG
VAGAAKAAILLVRIINQVTSNVSSTLILTKSPVVRYALGSLMYFAQGIPQGLLGIAIPAWLASEGAGAAAISSYLAIITLPWAFKLVTGPLMDRFEFLPMGRRRPWVIGAQACLSLSLLALTQVEDPATQIGLLSLIGFCINSFAATQDVAVDGMAIDVTPLREQGRLNGFMSFGKAIGWSATAAVSGVFLTTWGLGPTAVLAAAVSAAGLGVILAVRERSGERILPWTAGTAAAVTRATTSFSSVMREVNQVLWSRTSLIVMAIMLFDGLIYGYGQALMPIAAVNLFGYSAAQWSQLVAMMGLVGAVVALCLGPLIDRAGAKSMLIFTISLVGIHAFTLSQTQHLWENTAYVRAMLSIYVMMLPIVMVSTLALAMAICSSNVSATQFAIYMSMANVGHAIGSKVYGLVADQSSYVQSYTMISVFVVIMIVVLLFHRHRDDAPDTDTDTDTGDKQRKPSQRFTVGVAGSGAAAFWSGAIRCPKCRADMEQINYEGVEVDRCRHCKGLWFDAGEIQSLADKNAAAELDTGEVAVGQQHNAMQDYDCPRCSGTMARAVDAREPHISFETCTDCQGSFLDAGELRDLANGSLGEFFKSLLPRTPASEDS